MATDDFFRARLDSMIDIQALRIRRQGQHRRDTPARPGGRQNLPWQPGRGHTLAEQLEQTRMLSEDVDVEPRMAIVDLGFRGVDHDVAPVLVLHRGRSPEVERIPPG